MKTGIALSSVRIINEQNVLCNLPGLLLLTVIVVVWLLKKK